MVNTKELELELDLIRVACDQNALFKYQLIYRAGIATGVAGVYSFDEDWYYLYKDDTERYKVKRQKELEGIAPAFTYKQQLRRQTNQPDKQKSIKKNAAVKPLPMEVEVKIASIRSDGGIRATALVSLNNCLAIRNVKIIDGSDGLLVAMPGYKAEDGKYQEACLPVTEAFQQKLNAAVIHAYRQTLTQHQSAAAAPSSFEEAPEQSGSMRMGDM